MKRLFGLFLAFSGCCAAGPASAETVWTDVSATEYVTLGDDDLLRHSGDATFLDGLNAAQTRFSEGGFTWHLLRFINTAKPLGPLWVVPHDDENAAFDSAIAAVKTYGGVAIIVNSGPGSSRFQPGQGTCGDRAVIVSRCDPNRNFSTATPLYTQAFLDQLVPGQPIIALHTNSPGYGRGQGDITIVDTAAAAKGITRPRVDGYFGVNQPLPLQDHDSYAILPYRAPAIAEKDMQCRMALVAAGVNVWHERVSISDGSLSNYVTLNLRDTVYVNMETRREANLPVAAERHQLMIAAYLAGCARS